MWLTCFKLLIFLLVLSPVRSLLHSPLNWFLYYRLWFSHLCLNANPIFHSAFLNHHFSGSETFFKFTLSAIFRVSKLQYIKITSASLPSFPCLLSVFSILACTLPAFQSKHQLPVVHYTVPRYLACGNFCLSPGIFLASSSSCSSGWMR